MSGRQRKLSSGKMHLIRETSKISVRVWKAEGPLQSVVDLYESYEWTKALSGRQSKLSSGKMHLIRES